MKCYKYCQFQNSYAHVIYKRYINSYSMETNELFKHTSCILLNNRTLIFFLKPSFTQELRLTLCHELIKKKKKNIPSPKLFIYLLTCPTLTKRRNNTSHSRILHDTETGWWGHRLSLFLTQKHSYVILQGYNNKMKQVKIINIS